MRNLILNSDLKRVFQGAATVALGGLILGAVMQPTLKGPDGIGGPQMLMGVSGGRSAYAASDGASWTSYQGQIPDYVVGTDWLKPSPPSPAADPVMSVEVADEAQAEPGEPVDAVQTAWRKPARGPSQYPSMSGNLPTEADLPPPPEPPGDEDDPIAG